MAVSGTTSFSQSRNDVILDALSLIGRNSIGITPSADDVSLCNRFLNKMVKQWQSKGLHLWAKEEGILFLTPYVGQYDLGDSGTRFAEADNVTTTSLTVAAVAAQTTLTVGNTTGMAVNDNIGIVGDDGFIQWYLISSIPSTTSVIINSGLTSNISPAALVYTYTVAASKPMRVLDARVISGLDQGALGTSQTETPLTSVAYQSYFNVSMTTVSSVQPNQFTYVPKDTDGRIYIWPRATNASKRIQMTYERQIDDLDSARDSFDFPSEWLEPLTWQLAIRIGTPFGKESKVQNLLPLATQMLQDLLDWDAEVSSITFEPYYEGAGYTSYNGGEGWGR